MTEEMSVSSDLQARASLLMRAEVAGGQKVHFQQCFLLRVL